LGKRVFTYGQRNIDNKTSGPCWGPRNPRKLAGMVEWARGRTGEYA
jgi:hypothetical protein